MFRQTRVPTYEEFRAMYDEDKDVFDNNVKRSGYEMLKDCFPLVCDNNDIEFVQWLIDKNDKSKFPTLDDNIIFMMAVNNEFPILKLLYDTFKQYRSDEITSIIAYNAKDHTDMSAWIQNKLTDKSIEMFDKMLLNK